MTALVLWSVMEKTAMQMRKEPGAGLTKITPENKTFVSAVLENGLKILIRASSFFYSNYGKCHVIVFDK